MTATIATAMAEIRDRCASFDRVVSSDLALQESFMETAARFAGKEGTVALMSGGDLDCARYHLLGIEPLITFSGRGRRLSLSGGSTT